MMWGGLRIRRPTGEREVPSEEGGRGRGICRNDENGGVQENQQAESLKDGKKRRKDRVGDGTGWWRRHEAEGYNERVKRARRCSRGGRVRCGGLVLKCCGPSAEVGRGGDTRVVSGCLFGVGLVALGRRERKFAETSEAFPGRRSLSLPHHQQKGDASAGKGSLVPRPSAANRVHGTPRHLRTWGRDPPCKSAITQETFLYENSVSVSAASESKMQTTHAHRCRVHQNHINVKYLHHIIIIYSSILPTVILTMIISVDNISG